MSHSLEPRTANMSQPSPLPSTKITPPKVHTHLLKPPHHRNSISSPAINTTEHHHLPLAPITLHTSLQHARITTTVTMLPFLVASFLKDRILNKTFFVCIFTLISLIIYLFVLLGCISTGAGIESLYWVMISQNGTAGQPPVAVRIGYFGMFLC